MVSLKSATERNQFDTCTEMKAKTLIYLREVSLLPVKKKKKKKASRDFFWDFSEEYGAGKVMAIRCFVQEMKTSQLLLLSAVFEHYLPKDRRA